jgi:hypothetical protein
MNSLRVAVGMLVNCRLRIDERMCFCKGATMDLVLRIRRLHLNPIMTFSMVGREGLNIFGVNRDDCCWYVMLGNEVLWVLENITAHLGVLDNY